MGVQLLKSVGYWAGMGYPPPPFPHPRWLVRRGWQAANRPRIVRYLREAALLFGGMPSSYCRFGCFPIGSAGAMRELGGRTLTDGEWEWPQGLAHYVEQHSVRLPDEFVVTMAANSWNPPVDPELPARTRDALVNGGYFCNQWPWIWWGLRYGGPFAWMSSPWEHSNAFGPEAEWDNDDPKDDEPDE